MNPLTAKQRYQALWRYRKQCERLGWTDPVLYSVLQKQIFEAIQAMHYEEHDTKEVA